MQSGYRIKVLRTNRVREFTSHEFNSFCEKHGIIRQLTTPYSPQQNGVSEMKNRTIVEMARSLMKHWNLPNKLWAEVVNTAVYLLNISPTRAVKNKTPYESWHGVKPIVSHLRVFGCIAYSLIPSHKLQKLDTRSERCVFIGYCLYSKAYRLYNPTTCKTIVSRDVVFNESAGWD